MDSAHFSNNLVITSTPLRNSRSFKKISKETAAAVAAADSKMMTTVPITKMGSVIHANQPDRQQHDSRLFSCCCSLAMVVVERVGSWLLSGPDLVLVDELTVTCMVFEVGVGG
jgi:hypothetical protein